ncbi:MAG: phosphotransferase [Nocardioides sp.]|nr:phosphotransferase [Nocardioides sp.]
MTTGDLPADLTPLDGGWSGESFLAEAGGERTVVRIFADARHSPHAAEIQEALHRLVRGLVPVPDVVEVRRADPSADTPGLLVTDFVEGVRGDLLLPSLPDSSLAVVGERLGRIAATLAGMPFLSSGTFVDGGLRVSPFTVDLVDWLAEHEAALGWEPALVDGLREVADEAQVRLDSVSRVSLVHSDLNPKNVLVHPGTLQISAVLDWEYTHAGHPYADLGNLLRFDRQKAYADAVLRGFCALRGGSEAQALGLARSADLVALIELASRRNANPVAARAYEHLTAIARSGDIHAAP